jgi:hypothetical protein
METYTWAPGSNTELDRIFEQTRENNYQDLLTLNHKLKENYSSNSFDWAGIVANTIAFNNDGVPEICSTIAQRDCWPSSAYRILNRLWKHTNKVKHSKFISEAMVSNARSQIAWLEEHTDCELYFISRQTDNWMGWVSEKFKSQYNLDFNIAPHKYLTCPNECDDTCWQRVIYTGDEKLLNEWKSK